MRKYNADKISLKNKFLSYSRRFIKALFQTIVRSGRMRKRLTVLAYNGKALLSRKQNVIPSLFDYKAIISGPSEFVSNELYRGNVYYGTGAVLRTYSNYNKPINACIEHGLYFGNFIDKKECVKSGLHGLITLSNHRKKKLESYADIPIVTIGPYIHYAEPLLTELEIKQKKKAFGRTLLVFPSHSIDRVEVQYDASFFITKIKALAKQHEFKTVIVCLSWHDLLLERAEIYEKEGFIIVTNGYRQDPLFLCRLKTFIMLSDYTASNDVGTHTGYCIHLGKGHIVFNQEIKYKTYTTKDIDSITSAVDKSVNSEKEYVKQAFLEYSDFPNEKQKKVVREYWGTDCVHTKEEMHTILESLN